MKNYWFISGALINKNLYMITDISGHFMKVNLDSYKAEYLNLEKVIYLPQSAVILADQEFIYAVIAGGEYLLEYSVNNEISKFFYLGMKNKLMNSVASVQKYGEDLIIVPARSNSIVRINMVTGNIINDFIEHDAYQDGDVCFTKCNAIDKKHMWIFSNSKKEAIQYNMLTGEKVGYPYPEDLIWVVDVELWNGWFYILDSLGNIISWRIGFPVKMILKNPNGKRKKEFSLFHIAGKKIWLMPSHGEDIFCFDMESKECKKQSYYPDDFSYSAPKEMSKYPRKILSDRYCYFSMHAGNYMFFIEQDTGKGYWANIKWPDNKETIRYLMAKKEKIIHEKEIPLSQFCKYSLSREKILEESGETTGKKIWTSCIVSTNVGN